MSNRGSNCCCDPTRGLFDWWPCGGTNYNVRIVVPFASGAPPTGPWTSADLDPDAAYVEIGQAGVSTSGVGYNFGVQCTRHHSRGGIADKASFFYHAPEAFEAIVDIIVNNALIREDIGAVASWVFSYPAMDGTAILAFGFRHGSETGDRRVAVKVSNGGNFIDNYGETAYSPGVGTMIPWENKFDYTIVPLAFNNFGQFNAFTNPHALVGGPHAINWGDDGVCLTSLNGGSSTVDRFDGTTRTTTTTTTPSGVGSVTSPIAFAIQRDDNTLCLCGWHDDITGVQPAYTIRLAFGTRSPDSSNATAVEEFASIPSVGVGSASNRAVILYGFFMRQGNGVAFYRSMARTGGGGGVDGPLEYYLAMTGGYSLQAYNTLGLYSFSASGGVFKPDTGTTGEFQPIHADIYEPSIAGYSIPSEVVCYGTSDGYFDTLVIATAGSPSTSKHVMCFKAGVCVGLYVLSGSTHSVVGASERWAYIQVGAGYYMINAYTREIVATDLRPTAPGSSPAVSPGFAVVPSGAALRSRLPDALP